MATETIEAKQKLALKRLDKIIDDVTKQINEFYNQSKINTIINPVQEAFEENPVEKLVKDLSFVKYLSKIQARPETSPIQPLELFVDVVDTITHNYVNYNITNYAAALNKAEEIYTLIFPYRTKTRDFGVRGVAFVKFFDRDGVIASDLYNHQLFSTFKDVHNYVELMNAVSSHSQIKSCLNDITQYGLQVRAFFVDDDTYTANIKQTALKILAGGNRATVLKEEISRVEHMAGIYNIDEADVAKTEQQIIQANAILKDSIAILEQANSKTQHLNRVMKETTDTIQEIATRETTLIASKASTAKDDLQAAYNNFLAEQKQDVVLQKDILLGQIYEEAAVKLQEMKQMAKSITTTANSELLKINMETVNALDKIKDYISNDKELAGILKKADTNQELYDRIAKLEILNDKNIETITKGIEAQLAAQNVQPVKKDKGETPTAGAAVTAVPVATAVPVTATPVAVAPDMVVPAEISPVISAPATEVSGINPFLDTDIPFKERFERVQIEKRKRIAEGEHFHKMFDDVITLLMEDANPYMIGPSGCGKTFMVKQIASLLGLNFTDIGYINEEYDILGFQTATGSYSATNFYRCYKYGSIAFCDELDNGNSRATVKLNSFLSNSKDAQYSFPNGENVKRHSNFRIIAAGNTAGNGADANYNTREKIEESVQQRFTPIYVGYDNAVEEKILNKYKNWYQFIVLFRDATTAWGNQNDCSAPGIITTRDASRIKRYLDNQSLDMARILDYEFIQTKDMEYLGFLARFMSQQINAYPEAKDIFKLFHQKVNDLRANGGVR